MDEAYAECPLPTSEEKSSRTGSAREVFGVFLRLGMTSFGGPIAHVGYLRKECVERRGWLDDEQFAQLLAVCQFLPGPASSQLGFAIGLFRAGWRGALAAFAAFTLPSASIMFGLALLAPSLAAQEQVPAVLHGLKLVAVAVVAHGLIGMARQLTPDAPRLAIAAAATALILLVGGTWVQLGAIAVGGLLGIRLCRHVVSPEFGHFPIQYGRPTAAALLGVFLALLGIALAIPLAGSPNALSVFAAFYRTGALVFGGGHVVLPLLQQAVVDPGWVGSDTFLAGYGAAQAMPGPMFTLAAFVGAEVPLGLPRALAAAIALVAIFLPGLLLLSAVLPVWVELVRRPIATRIVAGINAAVVGLLAAALYDPVWREGIRNITELLIATVALVMLITSRVPILWVVFWCIGGALALHAL